MQFITFLTAATAILSSTVSASPLEKRIPGEILYLVNCAPREGNNGNANKSYMAWYRDVTKSWNGEFPNSITQPRSENGWGVPWDGRTQSFRFTDTGITVSATIDAGAGRRNQNDRTGTARNPWRGFTCYLQKDMRFLFESNGDICRALHYCT